MDQPPNDSHDITQAHQPFSPLKSRSRITSARVRLLPLNEGAPQPPLQASPIQSGTFQAPLIQPARASIWQRYQSLDRLAQIGVWCVAASLILFLFVCSLGAITGLKTAAGQGVAVLSTAQATTPTVVQNQAQPTAVQPDPTPVPPTPVPPTPTPTSMPQAATPVPVQPTRVLTGVNGNPWGYDFVSPGHVITNPPAGFCSGQYFQCTSHFSAGQGYVVQCNDGLYSKWGGHPDVCSSHGGYKHTLYSHA